MYSIDDPTKVTSLPTPEAADTEGFFTEGNPALGVPATRVRASWLNMLQAELRNLVVAAGLTPSKTVYNQVLTAIQTLVGGGRLLSTRTFTSSGTYTPTPGTSYIEVEVQGGGGAGGSTAALSAGQGAAAGPGNAGALAIGRMTAAAASGLTITIGAAGAAAAAGANAGGDGGDTVFGTVTARGGKGGVAGAATALPTAAYPLAAATATGGSIANVPGAIGNFSLVVTGGAVCALGANSRYGAGGTVMGGPSSGTATAAVGYGSGGVGAAQVATASTAAAAGTSGAPGLVIIREYS